MDIDQPKKQGKLKLRVGQFNVLNFVREETYFYDREKYTKEQVAKKVNWTAAQLQKMDADIVGFEEVFHSDVLRVRCFPQYLIRLHNCTPCAAKNKILTESGREEGEGSTNTFTRHTHREP